MAYREIPATAVEIQNGLWLDSYILTVGNMTREIRKLYSSVGYCFYDRTEAIYDEEGNLIPSDEILPTQRTYYQFMSVTSSKDLNDFVSVPVDDSYEIANRPSTNEVA